MSIGFISSEVTHILPSLIKSEESAPKCFFSTIRSNSRAYCRIKHSQGKLSELFKRSTN